MDGANIEVLVVEHEASTGLSLMAAGLGPAVRVVRPYLGEAFPELSEVGGVIVLGGSMGAMDDEIAPWLPATRALMAAAVEERLPILGICLGGQLLAAACGGAVERGADGLELGLVPVTPLPGVDSDPFFGRVQRMLRDDPAGSAVLNWPANQYHYDAVTRLPAGAELLVTGTPYPNQGFRVGPAAWGIQYHPEVSTESFAAWVEAGLVSGDLAAESAAVMVAIRAGSAAQSRLADAHARAFVDVVQGAWAARALP